MRPEDAFAILGLPERFDIPQRELRTAWMRRAAASHPDAAGAIDESARVNDAMRALSDPILRAHALLALRGVRTIESPCMPQELLLEMIDLRERADACAGDAEAMERLRQEARVRRDQAVVRVGGLFASAPAGAIAPERAGEILGEVNVIRAFDRMLEQLDRESSGSGEIA